MNEPAPIPGERPAAPCYAGLNLARDHHDLAVIDGQGRIRVPLRFEHSPAGWNECRCRLAPHGPIAIAVETNQGPAVEHCWPSAQAYDQHHRALGKSHACALRCLGQRELKILWKMWQTRAPYNEALHLLNQTPHGSGVLSLTTS